MRRRALTCRFTRGLLILAWLALGQPRPLPAQPAARPSAEVQALLDRGAAASVAHRTEEATALYDQALQQARERKDRPGEAAALVALSDAYRMRQSPKALAYCEQALSIYQALGDQPG